MKAQVLCLRSSAAAVLVLALAACAAPADPVESPSALPSPTPSATASPPPVEPTLEFRLPADCLDVLPASRLAQFDADGLSLLGGPGDSKFGAEYFLEKTPEERAGGITCVWGEDSSDFSSFVVSVAPLSPANRPSVVSQLTGQGLNATTEGATQYYWILGDDLTEPAQFNAIRSDSWVSVISTAGGQSAFEIAEAIGEEAATMVYAAG